MKFNRRTIPNALSALGRVFLQLMGAAPVVADDNVAADRRKRCRNCEHQEDGQCSICTCVIDLKTLLRTERCPIGRWERQTTFSTGL